MLVKSQVKYIQSLGQKKFRDQEGAFVAEGPKIVEELLKAPNLRPLNIYAGADWLAAIDPASLACPGRPSITGPGGSPTIGPDFPIITELRKGELERISTLSTPNQVLAIFS